MLLLPTVVHNTVLSSSDSSPVYPEVSVLLGPLKIRLID